MNEDDVSKGIQKAKRKQDGGMLIAVLSVCASIPVFMTLGAQWGAGVLVGGCLIGTIIGYS